MHLKSLSLKNFRNYRSEIFHFEEGIHCFLGDNAQGKTNLLEAINLLSTGRSFRSHKLKELIHYEGDHFFLEASFHKDGLSHHLRFSYNGQDKQIVYNNQNYPNFYPLFGLMPMVILSPEDIQLIHGGPQHRRRFFDLLIAQCDPTYLLHLTRYHKAMRQRNALLRSKSLQAIAPWEEIMATSAKILTLKRLEMITTMNSYTATYLTALSHGIDGAFLKYQTHTLLKKNLENYEEVFTKLLHDTKEKEILLGQTLIGPHRDDIEIFIGDKLADAFASEGQKRSLLIAIKFAEWKLLQEKLKTTPLLGFDDFGMHLDDQRRAWTREAMHNFGQVFITSPTPIGEGSSLSYHWIEEGKIKQFSLQSGAI